MWRWPAHCCVSKPSDREEPRIDWTMPVARRQGEQPMDVAVLTQIEADASERIAKATTLDELRALETELLGKKSRLVQLRQSLGGLDPDERKELGAALNAARENVGAILAERREA